MNGQQGVYNIYVEMIFLKTSYKIEWHKYMW